MKRVTDMLAERAEEAPARAAAIDADGATIGYGALAAEMARVADALRALGVRPGDRVMCVGENSVALVAAILGAMRLDAAAIPVNARMAAPEIARIRAHAEPRVALFTHVVSEPAADLATVMTAEASADHGAAALGEHGAAAGLRAVRFAGVAPDPTFADPAEQVAALFYTTGTTGAPKGVMLTHANFIYMSECSARIRGMTREDRVLCVLPMTHIFGFASALLASLRVGAEVELMARFDAAAVYAALCGGVSIFPGVPQMYAHLLRHAQEAGLAAPAQGRLKYLSAGGAPLDLAWKRKIEAFFGLPLHNGYGMTEAAPGICATRIDAPRADGAVGPPLEGQEVRLAPPRGRAHAAEGDARAQERAQDIGEVLTRGPNVMKGYYRAPEATADALEPGGWLRTGDLGRWTADGALEIVGRAKELIIRSGFNVHPPEVEAALNSHPGVTLAAVVGRPAADGGEEVVAFVEGAPGLEADALRAHCADRLTAYKRPSRILIVEALPAAPGGKVLKHRLLEHFADRL